MAGQLRGALLSATDPDLPGHDEVALLSAGPVDSAFYEHQLLADRMGVPVVTPRDLQVTEDGVFLVEEGGRRRLSALYRRIDERALLTAKGADLRPIGRAICNAAARGRVALVNAMGNGVADDKVVYAYVPEMITYYLDEAPLLANVPTYPCVDPVPPRRGARPARRRSCSSRSTATAGRASSSARTRAARSWPSWRRRSGRGPRPGWPRTSSGSRRHPTFSGDKLEPRAVDLRAFVIQSRRGSGTDVRVLPAALSRVAPAGSLIVNSSRGGGAKDTWVLREPPHQERTAHSSATRRTPHPGAVTRRRAGGGTATAPCPWPAGAGRTPPNATARRRGARTATTPRRMVM